MTGSPSPSAALLAEASATACSMLDVYASMAKHGHKHIHELRGRDDLPADLERDYWACMRRMSAVVERLALAEGLDPMNLMHDHKVRLTHQAYALAFAAPAADL